MKNIESGVILLLAGTIVFLLGIVLNSTLLFLGGIFILGIAYFVEADETILKFKKKFTDTGDSDDDKPEHYKVDDVSVEDKVLCFHNDSDKK